MCPFLTVDKRNTWSPLLSMPICTYLLEPHWFSNHIKFRHSFDTWILQGPDSKTVLQGTFHTAVLEYLDGEKWSNFQKPATEYVQVQSKLQLTLLHRVKSRCRPSLSLWINSFYWFFFLFFFHLFRLLRRSCNCHSCFPFIILMHSVGASPLLFLKKMVTLWFRTNFKLKPNPIWAM